MKRLALIAALLATGCAASVPVSARHDALAHPVLHFTFWGAYWANHQDEARTVGVHWVTLTDGSVLDRLAEYGVGKGRVDLLYAVPGNGMQQAMSSDDERAELISEIDRGLLPAPSTDDVYVVMMPPGTRTEYAIENGFTGYHAQFTYHDVSAAYIVAGYASGTDLVISHELYEAATDPFATNPVDREGHEVGDLCEWQTDAIDGYTVQQVWSVTEGKCL